MANLVALSDLQGNWDAVEHIARAQNAAAIVHTGNLGLWNHGTVLRSDVAYLKQLVAFSNVLDADLVRELNNQLVIALGQPAPSALHTALLAPNVFLSHMDAYVAGAKRLACPVYAIVGPLDDPEIAEQLLLGSLQIPNLHLINQHNIHEVPMGGGTVRLYGLGGNLKVHSLFDRGSLAGSLSGKAGDLWITLDMVTELYLGMKQRPSECINVFVAHAPVMKTPLMEHLAIVTGADFTVSQGLHFRYPVSGNGMAFVDALGGSAGYIDSYRLKFLRLRMILGELWLVIRAEVGAALQNDVAMARLTELGLALFDKIPVTIADPTEKIVRLTLGAPVEDEEEAYLGKQSLKKINDMYFAAYYNLWHFNLCDHLIREDDDDGEDYNVVVFRVTPRGEFKMVHCAARGFLFRHDDEEDLDTERQLKKRGRLRFRGARAARGRS